MSVDNHRDIMELITRYRMSIEAPRRGRTLGYLMGIPDDAWLVTAPRTLLGEEPPYCDVEISVDLVFAVQKLASRMAGYKIPDWRNGYEIKTYI